MIRLIEYLLHIGYEDADTNFAFLSELILSDKYDENYGCDFDTWLSIRLIIKQENIFIG